MTKQKYTPRPWYIGSGTYEGQNIYSAEAVTDDEGFTYNPVVATVEDDGVVCWEANALLITAAPDLLEALQMLLEFPNTGPATTTAYAAIAKATGGTND